MSEMHIDRAGNIASSNSAKDVHHSTVFAYLYGIIGGQAQMHANVAIRCDNACQRSAHFLSHASSADGCICVPYSHAGVS